jgi:hydrogenase maturation protease
MTARRLVVGVGSAVRGDDAVGLEVAERVRALALRGVDVDVVEPLDLVTVLAGREHVVLVDASAPAGRPGTVRRLAVGDGVVEGGTGGSSHGYGVAEALGLARALGVLPPTVVLVAVEAADVRVGAALSPEAAGSVDEAVAEVVDALDLGT